MSQEEIKRIIETTDNYNGYLLSYFANRNLIEILKKKMEQQKQPMVIIKYLTAAGTFEKKVDILNYKLLSNIEAHYL